MLLDASRLNVIAGLMDRRRSDLVLGTLRPLPTGPTPRPTLPDWERDAPAGDRLGDEAVLLRTFGLTGGPGDDLPPSTARGRAPRLYDPSDGLCGRGGRDPSFQRETCEFGLGALPNIGFSTLRSRDREPLTLPPAAEWPSSDEPLMCGDGLSGKRDESCVLGVA